jgi:hypothetical protein
MTFQGLKKLVREIHSEPGPNGTLSWGRCASTGMLVAVLIFIGHIVFHSHVLPDLAGASAFAVSPYAANRVATAVQSFSSNPVTPNPNPNQQTVPPKV